MKLIPRKLTPRTLQVRIVLLILVLLVGGQYAALRLFENFELEQRANAGALQIVSTVNLTRAALLAARADRRLLLLQHLNQSEGIRVYPIDYFEEIEPLSGEPLLQRIAEKVREQLGVNTLIAVNHLGLTGVWVSFSIFGDDYWAVIPNVQTQRAIPWQWLGWGALVIALSLFGAWFIMLRINRPLNVLAQAVDAIGRGQLSQDLPEVGAEEFTRVIHAFNEMMEALARTESDRHLLLGGVSHDLRTPLARLRLAVEMLPESDQLNDLKAGMVQDIGDMDAIIGQFLDFVRGAEGEAEVETDIHGLLRDIASRYARQGKLLPLELDTMPEIKLRPLAMRRLLTNLIDNAFHYAGDKVKIRARQRENHIEISVIDQGPGLPQAETERLLRPFERLDIARGNRGGAGLGLAIAARVARLHGGALKLQNITKGGLEARVEIPVAAVYQV
jgi:two-component system, OmpR family, osmolarity sensor histidine kinase EnvZ